MTELQCDAVIFDLDGVLVDSTACVERHWSRWGEKHGLDVAELLRIAHGMRTVETVRLVAPHLDAEKEAQLLEGGEAVDVEGVDKVEGAERLLSSLSPGQWAVVTSGTRQTATTRLRHIELPLPRVLVTADDVSHGKPHPEPYLMAASQLGIAASRCVVVEDTPAGIQSAQAAGMRVIAVGTTYPSEDLRQAEIVGGLLDNLEILKNKPSFGAGLIVRVNTNVPEPSRIR